MKKNIYLIYPPGYSGSYVSWCLSKSEAGSKDTTVDDPINPTNNTKYGGAGNFDFEYVNSYHHNYIEAQQHLKFINEINTFKKTKVLTEYLDSHPLIQALVIREIFDQLSIDWETKTLQEIINNLKVL